ncbi:MAG: hypothetical protein AB4372_27070 [Xenococcus sp. (in: cyanobacteria)]
MSQVIRIPDELYKRLEAKARGFDTPANVIERLLNLSEGEAVPMPVTSPVPKAHSLEIIFYPAKEDEFKALLLQYKKAFVKITKTDGTSQIKEWNASKFSSESSIVGNLRSGQLRNWKEKGICKAEVAINREQLTSQPEQQAQQNQLNKLAGKIKAFKDIDPVTWQQEIRSEWDETRLPN